MDYKIVQIIPAPSNMYALYEAKTIDQIKNKVVCLALIEYDDGEREVIPMDITSGDGLIDKIGDDLKSIEFS